MQNVTSKNKILNGENVKAFNFHMHTPFLPIISVTRPLVIAPSIAPMVTKEPNIENCQFPKHIM